MSDAGELIDTLVTELPHWLPGRRWFAGKDRPITAVTPLAHTVLLDGDPLLVHLVVAVEQDDRSEDYQLLVATRGHLPESLTASWIGAESGVPCYEATGDADLTAHLLDLIAAGNEIDGVRFAAEPDVELDTGLRARPITAEQSNSSLVFGNRYILKLFRKLTPGENQDLRLHRALRDVGCEHIAAPLGAITGTLRGEPVTFGLLQRFEPDAVDGWAMATTSVRDLMADPELPPEALGGDFAGEARRLGQAVAAVHADLLRAFGDTDADAAEFDRTIAAMRARLTAMIERVPELAEFAPALLAAYDRVREVDGDVRMQFVHGDLHLGQVLRTVHGWLLIDFEGEPAAPVAERAALRSPLRDVAGMLRSFDYAAHSLLIGQDAEGADPRLTERAMEWARRNRAAFCDGYAEAAGNVGDPRDHGALLRAFELDKAVYEIGYEQANRPDWLSVPLSSIARIATGGEQQ